MDGVKDWLGSSGIHHNRTSLSANKQWVQFDATIGELESLLKTQYHVYEHDAGHEMPSCDQYYVPCMLIYSTWTSTSLTWLLAAHLGDVVDYITPGVNLGQPSDLKKRGTAPGTGFKLPLKKKPLPSFSHETSNDLGLCSSVVTPACIKGRALEP